MSTGEQARGHRPLVFVTDDESTWGLWCMDCQLYHFGFTSELRPSRLAKRHVKDTRVQLQEDLLMATCHLCGDTPPDPEMWEHLRLMHPDQWGPERWPDGEPVIHDLALDPDDFGEA